MWKSLRTGEISIYSLDLVCVRFGIRHSTGSETFDTAKLFEKKTTSEEIVDLSVRFGCWLMRENYCESICAFSARCHQQLCVLYRDIGGDDVRIACAQHPCSIAHLVPIRARIDCYLALVHFSSFPSPTPSSSPHRIPSYDARDKFDNVALVSKNLHILFSSSSSILDSTLVFSPYFSRCINASASVHPNLWIN